MPPWRNPRRWASHRQYALYGAIMLGSSLMNNLFVTYYILFFTQIEVLNSFWFYIGQIVFALWNALNDPLFGWISDNAKSSQSRVMQRLQAIRIGGYIWVASFITLWYPWTTSFVSQSPQIVGFVAGIHFMTSLTLYDGGLTYVEVNHGALLNEITSTSQERAKYNMWSAIWAGIGSCSSLFAHMFWDKDNLARFQNVAWVVSLLSVVTFEVSTRQLEKIPHKQHGLKQENNKAKPDGSPEALCKASGSFSDFLSQLAHHRNFMIFAVLSAIQAFDCTFEKNFFAAFMDALAGEQVTSAVRGSIISASFLLPHACTVIATPIIRSWGLYDTVKYLFVLRLGFVVAAVLVTFGLRFEAPALASTAYGICGFMLVNRVASEATCRLFPLILSDLIDEDRVMNKRPKSLSSSMIGTASFTSKISQSLAPMVGFYITPPGSIASSTPVDERNVEIAKKAMPTNTSLWWILLTIPLFCIVLEAIFWSMYTLRGRYLHSIQKSLTKNEELGSLESAQPV